VQGFRTAEGWRNAEMTCYYYLDTKAVNFNGHMTAFAGARSGSHALAASSVTTGCNGTGYFVGMISSADRRITKEYSILFNVSRQYGIVLFQDMCYRVVEQQQAVSFPAAWVLQFVV
jgi:hypothetical protein